MLKKRNKGIKDQNSIRLTVSSIFVPQDILTPKFSTDEFQEPLQVTYVTHNAHNYNINIRMTKEECLKLYCQGNTLSEIIYFGSITTMEFNLSHPNFFHQPSYNLQMYKKYILTTLRFPSVYSMIPTVITPHSTHLERKTTLPLRSFSNLTISMEYIPKKLIYSNSKEKTTSHLGTLSSRYHTVLN